MVEGELESGTCMLSESTELTLILSQMNTQTVHFILFQASDFSSAYAPWEIRWMVSEPLALHCQCLDQKHPKRRAGIKELDVTGSSVLCDDLEGWDGCVGGRFEREGINVYTWLIDFVVQRNEHKIVRQLYSN